MLNAVLIEKALPCRSEDKRFVLSLATKSKADADLLAFTEADERNSQKVRAGQLFQPGEFAMTGNDVQMALVGYNNTSAKKQIRVLADGHTLVCESGAMLVVNSELFSLSALQPNGELDQSLDLSMLMVLADGSERNLGSIDNVSWVRLVNYLMRYLPSTQPFIGLRFKYLANGAYAKLALQADGSLLVGSELEPIRLNTVNRQWSNHAYPYLLGEGTLDSPISLFYPPSNTFQTYKAYRNLPAQAQVLYYKIVMPNASVVGPNVVNFLGDTDTTSWEVYADATFANDLRASQTGRVLVLSGWGEQTSIYIKQILTTPDSSTSIVVRTGDSIGDWALTSLIKSFITPPDIGPIGSGDGEAQSPYVIAVNDSGTIDIDSIATWATPTSYIFHFVIDVSTLASNCKAVAPVLDKPALLQQADDKDLFFTLYEDALYNTKIGGTTGYGGSSLVLNSGTAEGFGDKFTKPSSNLLFGKLSVRFPGESSNEAIYGQGRKIRLFVQSDLEPAAPALPAPGTGTGAVYDPYILAVNDVSTLLDIDAIMDSQVAVAQSGRFYMLIDVSSFGFDRHINVFNYRDAQTISPDMQLQVFATRFYSLGGGSVFTEDGLTTSNGLYTSTVLNPALRTVRDSAFGDYSKTFSITTQAGIFGQGYKLKVLVEQGALVS